MDGAGLEKTIHISPMGGLGNRMIQYLAALALADRVPGSRVVHVHLPEWGISVPRAECEDKPTALVLSETVPLDALAAALRDGAIERVDLRSYAQRMENFSDVTRYAGLFTTGASAGAGPHELLINIRQGELLDARHPDYVLIPVDFYAELVERTKLAPVFMGQIEDSAYMRGIFARFPHARYLPSRGATADFAYIRHSHHIVPAISTFSWLAAWMSKAGRVFLPVLGLFNTLQSRTTDLLPLGDPRYVFTLFPFHYAVPVRDAAAAHATIAGRWREMTGSDLADLRARADTARSRDACLAAFDEAYYLATHPDVAQAVADGGLESGARHYELYGFDEGRAAFRTDAGRYCLAYPEAACELSRGVAPDVFEHWHRFGRARLYASPLA